ncbi:aspartate-semialdehyde dehydrogenase [Blattabacterium cuenoti]|uniref:aspartate-semialdehyde dehydrogenase n=1 Tax=Blattabacterium cuenoti TaxID=1653831 RepID=UPI00163D08D0|nr:aspartate-semialdehyde dehydrogenase [Blattabacterium cuenoti]
MRIGIVGATGMVGRVIMDILEKETILFDLYLSASNRSIGKEIFFKGKSYKIIGINELILKKPNIVLFSAGSKISKNWAKKFSNIGSFVIDNSSAWRMDPEKKLIIPEVNDFLLKKKDKIISNPNCSTIQLVMVLHPLHKIFSIDRVIVSTYQSVTGTGKKALDQLEEEKSKGFSNKKIYPYPIHQNVIPQCDNFTNNGYTLEEMKLINETKKIMNDNNISITATSVRVPVIGGHSESVNITFKKNININYIKEILMKTKGIVVQDKPENNIYPMPIFSHGKDEVFVGRIRMDNSYLNSINIWIVSDNLRKGSATNAIQIAKFLIKKKYV